MRRRHDHQKPSIALINSLANDWEEEPEPSASRSPFAVPAEESESLVVTEHRRVSMRYIYTDVLTALCFCSLHMRLPLIQLRSPTRPRVGSLKQKFEGFALISNQNSVFITGGKRPKCICIMQMPSAHKIHHVSIHNRSTTSFS